MIRKIPGAIYYTSTTDKTKGENYLYSKDTNRFVDISKHCNTDNENCVDSNKFNKFYLKNWRGEWILNSDLSKNTLTFLNEVQEHLMVAKTGTKQEQIDKINNYLESYQYLRHEKVDKKPKECRGLIYVKKDGKCVEA